MTLTDYIEMVIENGAVDNAGEEFNLDAIAEELNERFVAENAQARGTEYALNVDIPDEDFWEIVAKHAK